MITPNATVTNHNDFLNPLHFAKSKLNEANAGVVDFFFTIVFFVRRIFFAYVFLTILSWNQLTSFSVLRVSLTRLSKLYSFFFNRSYPKHEMQIVDIGFGVVIIKLKQHAADFLFLPSWDKFVRQPRGSEGWFFFLIF